ncbi:probable cationic amino acid transporter [Branchiostoma lanceolatum]|uniref:probable cationic amino acid transporter n=1 Tax=Branchiostoma lanceolatum TaxID=7740 RepID=UPI0034514AEE
MPGYMSAWMRDTARTLFRTRRLDTIPGSESPFGPDSTAGEGAPVGPRATLIPSLLRAGLGGEFGLGLAVLTGYFAVQGVGGPVLLLSLAGVCVTNLLTGLVHTELRARALRVLPDSSELPDTYSCCYATIGEFVAYVIGWTSLLQLLTGAACCARALSQTIDYLSGHVMSDELSLRVGGLPHMTTYPDFLAFTVGVLSCLASSQLKPDVQNFFLDIFHVLAGTLLVFVFSVGLFFTQSANWTQTEMTTDVIRVVASGAAILSPGFLGFEELARTGVERKGTKKRNVWAALVMTPFAIVSYFTLITVVQSHLSPQSQVDHFATLPSAFAVAGANFAKYIVAFWQMAILSVALIFVSYRIPQLAENMANDGLVTYFLRKRAGTTKPVVGIVLVGIFVGFLSLGFQQADLIELCASTSLVVQTISCACVIILRYQVSGTVEDDGGGLSRDSDKNDVVRVRHQSERSAGIIEVEQLTSEEHTTYTGTATSGTLSDSSAESSGDENDEDDDNDEEVDIYAIMEAYRRRASDMASKGPAQATPLYKRMRKYVVPTRMTGYIATFMVLLSVVSLVALATVCVRIPDQVFYQVWGILVLIGLTTTVLGAVGVLLYLPQGRGGLVLRAPLMPWLAVLAMVGTSAMMAGLADKTWILYGGWMAIGILNYLFYGVCHSTQRFAKGYQPHETEAILLQPISTHALFNEQVIPSHVGKRHKHHKCLTFAV